MLPSNEYGVSNTVLSEVDALRWFSSSTLSCLPSATTLKPSPVSATVKSFDSIVVTLRYILLAEDCNGITFSTFTFTRTDVICKLVAPLSHLQRVRDMDDLDKFSNVSDDGFGFGLPSVLVEQKLAFALNAASRG